MVNKCVPGKVRIGRIDLRDNFSFFEVEEGEANRVMDSMNGFEVDGRRISVEPAQAKGEGGKGSRGSRGGSRSGNGFRDRRDSGRKGRDSVGKATVETVAVDVPAVAMTNRSVNSMRTLLVERKNAVNKNRYS